MLFPELLLRGIPNKKDFIDAEGQISAHLFYFTKKTLRADEYDEESIFWKDDDEAVQLILDQRKSDGEIQFKGGAVLIKRNEIDKIAKLNQVRNRLSYERKVEKENPYHGNLLLEKTVKKPLMSRIAAAIAITCEEIIHNEN